MPISFPLHLTLNPKLAFLVLPYWFTPAKCIPHLPGLNAFELC